MGDKSPKSARKQAHQKQTKVDADKQKREAAEAVKTASSPKLDTKK